MPRKRRPPQAVRRIDPAALAEFQAGIRKRYSDEEIPLGARIIHVADALDSMLTTRIYRAARPAAEALQELRRAAGSQFCPRCVAALERILPVEEPAAEREEPQAAAIGL